MFHFNLRQGNKDPADSHNYWRLVLYSCPIFTGFNGLTDNNIDIFNFELNDPNLNDPLSEAHVT